MTDIAAIFYSGLRQGGRRVMTLADRAAAGRDDPPCAERLPRLPSPGRPASPGRTTSMPDTCVFTLSPSLAVLERVV
ncbi:hypothetical protein GCM10023194_33470 [Planotetraspora phitsanulokensis]|uniref:Uncharacterized protein n=1 Tax=Planotetraspora phitsanulokensis TaxID=575192 RepID=A0A8J3UCH3_9ACTN|nr:hypothetical protein [Planotetraspora phitsanulokensis]GII36525.1 hypothetical protein Pph01_15280 [Planotetraspora phitsanulokensis]